MISYKRTGWRTDVIVGLSTETKPTDVENGYRFCEIDTGYMFAFDAEHSQWHKLPGSSVDEDEVRAIIDDATAELQAELDEAISGATEDSEVINARVTSDGTTYSTLKARLDAENTELKNALNSVATGEAVRVYPSFQIGYLHGIPNKTPSDPGQNVNNNTVCSTDYIEIDVAKKLYFDSTNYNICVCYYDENKVYQTYVGFVSTPNPYVLNTEYAYFVPEFRKKDSSAFTDASVVNGTAYYEYVEEADIVRHAEFGEAIDEINEEISTLETRKVIQPEILPTLPIDVYRTFNGYACDSPLTDLDVSGYTNIYIDSANGDDTNDGSVNAPVKTLNRAEYLMRKYPNNTIMNIVEGSIFYYDDLPLSYNTGYNLIIRSESGATVFGGKKPEFTQSGDHYESEALTGLTLIGCVDTTSVDDYGLYKPMTVCTSATDVDTNDNSYYIDTSAKVVYVNTSNIDNIVVIISNKYVAEFTAYKLSTDGFIMVENINFVGPVTAKARVAATTGESISRGLYLKNCTFQHSFANNAISMLDFEWTYVVDCTAGYSKLDGYNYHFTLKPTPTDAIVVEVNSKGKECGYYYGISGTSDQISTCHDGANILRCNTHGYNTDGSQIADVNGCYSVCLDCTVINTSYVGSSGANYAPYRFNNNDAIRNGKTVMQNCYGYDSRNDKLVTAVDLEINGIIASGSINATTIRVGKELI